VAGVSPRPFLCWLGILLLAQGTLSLILDAAGRQSAAMPLRLVDADPGHALIHVAWGLALVVLIRRGFPDVDAARLAILFGVFYGALAVAGLAVHHPLGLRFDRGENVFHVIVATASLAVGLAALRLRARPA
jgi:hypothetical protein